jgi:hypothetical protein
MEIPSGWGSHYFWAIMLRGVVDDSPCDRVGVDTPSFLAGDPRWPDRPTGVETLIHVTICSYFQGDGAGDIPPSPAAEDTRKRAKCPGP